MYATFPTGDPSEELTPDNNLAALIVMMIDTRTSPFWTFNKMICPKNSSSPLYHQQHSSVHLPLEPVSQL